MDDLYQKLAGVAKDVPYDRMLALAAAVERLGSLSGYMGAAISALGPVAARGKAHAFLAKEIDDTTLSPSELSVAIRAAAASFALAREQTKMQILWTGPATTSVPVRMTEQAFCDLVDMATKTLFVVSFVAFKAESVYARISEAVARGVKVSFLTESSKKHGGTLDYDPIELLQKKIPDAAFYRWAAEMNVSEGCVHAKCAIADRRAALITSANLTDAAMEKNMELGLLVENEHLAGRLADHFAALETESIIERI